MITDIRVIEIRRNNSIFIDGDRSTIKNINRITDLIDCFDNVIIKGSKLKEKVNTRIKIKAYCKQFNKVFEWCHIRQEILIYKRKMDNINKDDFEIIEVKVPKRVVNDVGYSELKFTIQKHADSITRTN